MPDTNSAIPDLTIETLSRNFYRESVSYGFTQMDYVRFVNRLLDLSMQQDGTDGPASEELLTSDVITVTETSGADGPTTLPLAGPRIAVRQFVPADDLPHLERWVTDPVGRYFMLSRTTSRELSLAELVHSEHSVLGVITLPDGNAVGCVAFLDLDEPQRKAELRKLIGESTERGKGFGKEASKLWIRYGLTTLGLRKIYLNTLDTNIRNVRLNEELGFRIEGILRNEVLIDGEYRDVLRMGLWRE